MISVLAVATASKGLSAEQTWAGEYADRNFLDGRGVFQMSLQQSGSTVSVWFSTGYNDGHGCSPDATGTGKATAKGVEFSFSDSANNSGTGTITRAGDGIAVAIKLTRVADPRCLEFYGKNVLLKRVKK